METLVPSPTHAMAPSSCNSARPPSGDQISSPIIRGLFVIAFTHVFSPEGEKLTSPLTELSRATRKGGSVSAYKTVLRLEVTKAIINECLREDSTFDCLYIQ